MTTRSLSPLINEKTRFTVPLSGFALPFMEALHNHCCGGMGIETGIAVQSWADCQPVIWSVVRASPAIDVVRSGQRERQADRSLHWWWWGWWLGLDHKGNIKPRSVFHFNIIIIISITFLDLDRWWLCSPYKWNIKECTRALMQCGTREPLRAQLRYVVNCTMMCIMCCIREQTIWHHRSAGKYFIRNQFLLSRTMKPNAINRQVKETQKK